MNPGDPYNPHRLFRGCFIPDWLAIRREVSAGAKLCFAALLRHVGKDGECFPKVETVAAETGMGTRMCATYIAELKKKELIRSKRGGDGQPSRYEFLWHGWVEGKGAVSEVQDPAVQAVSDVQDAARLNGSDMQDAAKTDMQDAASAPSKSYENKEVPAPPSSPPDSEIRIVRDNHAPVWRRPPPVAALAVSYRIRYAEKYLGHPLNGYEVTEFLPLDEEFADLTDQEWDAASADGRAYWARRGGVNPRGFGALRTSLYDQRVPNKVQERFARVELTPEEKAAEARAVCQKAREKKAADEAAWQAQHAAKMAGKTTLSVPEGRA